MPRIIHFISSLPRLDFKQLRLQLFLSLIESHLHFFTVSIHWFARGSLSSLSSFPFSLSFSSISFSTHHHSIFLLCIRYEKEHILHLIMMLRFMYHLFPLFTFLLFQFLLVFSYFAQDPFKICFAYSNASSSPLTLLSVDWVSSEDGGVSSYSQKLRCNLWQEMDAVLLSSGIRLTCVLTSLILLSPSSNLK